MNGDVAVDLFLVLSGFLLGGSLFKEFSTTGTVGYGSFYARRWFRIGPALIFATVIGSVTNLPEGSWQGCVVEGHWWSNLLFFNNYFPQWTAWSPTMCMIHSWSVAVEFQLYCITPPLFALAWFLSQRLPKFSFATHAFIVIFILWSNCAVIRIVHAIEHSDEMISKGNFELPYVWTQYRSCPYFSGIAAGIAVQQHSNGKFGFGSPALQSIFVFISALIALSAVLFWGEPLYFAQSQKEWALQNAHFMILQTAMSRPLIGLASSYLLALATTGHAPRLNRFLSLQCWTPLAGVSYSVYLLQYVGWGILLLPVSRLTFGKLSGTSLPVGIDFAWVQPLMALVATVPLALLCYVLVERTGILLGQRATCACSTRKSSPAEAPDVAQPATKSEQSREEPQDSNSQDKSEIVTSQSDTSVCSTEIGSTVASSCSDSRQPEDGDLCV